MVDSVIAGTGNSRYLRTSLSSSTTWEESLTMLRAGTFPIDLAGVNQAGFTTLGTALNSATLLKSAVITALGLDADATPSDAWEAVIALIDDKADEDSVVTAVTYNSNTKELTATINGTATVVATFDFVNATEAANAAPVQSVAGKTGNVTLDGGNISYDDSATYPSGSVGAEVADLKSAIGENGANILSAYPTDTASGAIASFSDGAALPVKALTVDIEPVQSGSGDPAPDNVRPISGWTGAKVTRTGKNLLDCSGAITSTASNVTFTNNNDGTWTLNGTASAFAGKAISANRILNLKAGVTYKITGGVTNLVNAYLYKAGVGTLVVDTGLGATYTPAEDIVDVAFYLSMTAGKVANNLVAYPMLSIDGTGTGWEPYTEQTLPISWQSEAGTVYGGTLDVTTGVLTVTQKAVDMGTLEWEYQNQYTRFYADIPDMFKNPSAGVRTQPLLTPIFKCIKDGSSSSEVDNCIYNGGSDLPRRIFVQHFALTDAGNFTSFVNGYIVVYKLDEPFTVQLTPAQLSTLLGANNIWADTGDVSAEYRADPTLYIRKLTGPAESDMVADANIASGQYFLVGNRLFLATAAIAAGAALTVGTNCTETNLAAALNALNS